MNATTTGALAKKLAKILGEIGKVPKSGHNAFHKYDYVTENDLVYAVRDKLAAASVFVFTSVEAQSIEVVSTINSKGEENKAAITSVVTRHTFVDGDSGEEFSVLSQGQGADNGDKGGYKAITGAMKYFLYKCFMIPTGDDPESDEKTDARTAGGFADRKPIGTKVPPITKADLKAGTNADSKASPEVPRDRIVELREKFRDGAWRTVTVHFGKNKGIALDKLDDKQLGWYVEEWVPKPFGNRGLSDDDQLLRAALDVAGDEAFTN